MDLDGSTLSSPILELRRRELDSAVRAELKMIRNKVRLASDLGYFQCTYQVLPSLRWPDPKVLLPRIIKILNRKNFSTTVHADNIIYVDWNPSGSTGVI